MCSKAQKLLSEMKITQNSYNTHTHSYSSMRSTHSSKQPPHCCLSFENSLLLIKTLLLAMTCLPSLSHAWSLYLFCVHGNTDHVLSNVEWIISSASVGENFLSAVIIKAAYQASAEKRGREKKESCEYSVWLWLRLLLWHHSSQINLQSVYPSNMTPLLANYLSRTASFQWLGSTSTVSHCLSSRLTGAWGM